MKVSPIHCFVSVCRSAFETVSYEVQFSESNKRSFERIGYSGALSSDDELYCKGCNVILIFAEGTSRRILSRELTPNIFNLIKDDSLNFTNYYNHQAATFRGIRGSLISGFVAKGGWMGNGWGFGEQSHKATLAQFSNTVESLPSVLNEKGYSTFFLSPHTPKDALAIVMQATGFSETAITSDSHFDSDKVTYEKLFNRALDLSRRNNPFLLTAYIVGTHHGLDSPDLKYGDGRNSYLNKFNNQDHWFGEFVKKFKNSTMSENTLIVFTADHATYPVKEFQATFKTSVGEFHDEIPLVIYRKGITHRDIDAGFRSSLALAPTILDILGVNGMKNHFLTNSLFSTPSQWERFAAQGNYLLHIDEDGVVRRTEDCSFREMLKKFYSFSR